MKVFLLRAALVLIASIAFIVGVKATANNLVSFTDDSPAVISAVAPIYPSSAFTTGKVAVGKVVVEVTIDAKGVVTEARMLSGHPLFKDACESAARNWLFVGVADLNLIRTAHLTFNFSNLADEPKTPEDKHDLIIFKPPYEVEIHKYFVIIDRQTNRSH